MTKLLEGFVPYREDDVERYRRMGWWPSQTLGDLLDRAADVYPDKVAFVDGRTRLTFSEARERADRLAVSLMRCGLRPLDRVLVQLPNWNEFVIAYFALQKIGAIDVLLIDRYRQYEINHLIALTGARGWILPEQYRKIDFLPILADVRAGNPQLEHVILVRGGEHKGCRNLERLVEEGDQTETSRWELAERRPDPMQVAHMGPTGGTTGLPKVVPRTHSSLICSCDYAALAWDFGTTDTCLLAGPIGHDLTFTKGFLGGVITFAKLVFLDSTDMGDICGTIEREEVSAVAWVPTLANRLVQYESLDDYNLGSLKKMYCGGSPGHPDFIFKIRESLGCSYYNGYGGTEGQTCITRSGDDLETICNTVGRPTCPYDTYEIVSPSGAVQPPGTSGELLIKGPGVFTGYYKNDEENAKAFDPEGFFRTGDVAKMDGRGNITLTGRVKEMINRGGESISATEIEKLIMDHPDVLSVAVVPMPDPELGERACAYIQKRQGVQLSFDVIISFLKGKKASVLQLPERIEFLEAMPYTKAEKIDKGALREDIAKKVSQAG